MFFCEFLHITQVHIQYHVTTIRCISTCINKQKCVQPVAVSKGSLATYFDFWKEGMKHTIFIYSFGVFGANFSPLECSLPFSVRALPPGVGGGGGVTTDLNLNAYSIKYFRYAYNK